MFNEYRQKLQVRQALLKLFWHFSLSVRKYSLSLHLTSTARLYGWSIVVTLWKCPLLAPDITNIGERLGTKNGYNGYARADFIKAMFPDVMKDIEQDSIRNFKFQPNKGSIVIDEPDEDDYHFHIK